MTNYCPISLISNLSKIFENIIKIRLVKFLDHCNFIQWNQFGFRKNLSTGHALQLVTNKLYCKLLFEKLEQAGRRSAALDLIKS